MSGRGRRIPLIDFENWAGILIVDSGHVRWMIGTAAAAASCLAFYVWRDRATPGGLTGGTTAGLWFGVFGSALMVFAGSFAVLRIVPSWWWIGSRKAWLKAHIWLGSLSVVVILCHASFRWGGPVEFALWVVLGLIVASGIIGIVLQQTLPSLMTHRVPNELSFEQIPHYCDVLRRRADDLADALDAELPSGDGRDSPAAQFGEAYSKQIRPFFATSSSGQIVWNGEADIRGFFDRIREVVHISNNDSPAEQSRSQLEQLRTRIDPGRLKDMSAKLDELGKKLPRLFDTDEPAGMRAAAKECFTALNAVTGGIGAADVSAGIERSALSAWLAAIEHLAIERMQVRQQEWIHRWLHGWLLVHAPLSALLLVLAIAHIVMSLYY